MASANRDEERYEDGDQFDVFRPKLPHMSFGFGSHFCSGHAVSRALEEIILEETFAGLPRDRARSRPQARRRRLVRAQRPAPPRQVVGMTWHPVDAPEEAHDGTIVGAEVAGVRIALVRTDSSRSRGRGRVHALESAHSRSTASSSTSHSLCCNCHGAEFDVETGAVLADPATEDLRVYALEERDGSLAIEIDAP